MSPEQERINRFLDGELSEEEREQFLRLVTEDAALRRELTALQETIDVVESARRPVPPFSFAGEIMAQLPPLKKTFRRKMGDFFFASHMLRWNMAGAMAVLLVVGLMVVLQLQLERTPRTPSQPSREDASAAVVTFRIHAPEARSVALAGEFNRWKTDDILLKKQEGNVWTVSLPLNPGVYSYMFVIDGEVWLPDPDAGLYRDDGFGYKNSVLKVNHL